MNRVKLLFTRAAVFCALATHAGGASADGISNGLMEVRIHAGRGTYDVIDLKRKQTVIRDAQIGFSTAPYLELSDVGENEVETSPESVAFKSGDCVCRASSPGSLICRREGVGELEVRFELKPGQSVLNLGFSFQNLGKKPVRLRRVSVLDGGYLPSLDRSQLLMLNGNSGGQKTLVRKACALKSENNLLCFVANPAQPRSLVAGGLTYADYRKYVDVTENRIDIHAHDPVGRRVDPGKVYHSPDRFYLDAMTDNPFEALEAYARATQEARGIKLNYHTFPSTCMWFLAVTHFGADTIATNSSAGAVAEMQRIADSGFLKYAPVAVRLVPDCYEQNNQQGWWDEKHWRMHGRKERCVVERHYEEPYETTRKWATAVSELGGIPLIYFQPGIRSEDYATAFPGHMLYNRSHKYVRKDGKMVGDPHWVIGQRGIPDLLNPGKWIPGYGKLWQEPYDYTDPAFLAHWTEVNRRLAKGGVQGVFYDYPSRAFAARGGLEDRYATATHAYCNVFRIAREQLGPGAHLQERLGVGSDATLESVNSVRTAGDNNILNPTQVNSAAMRWYKNRRLTNYDMDGKALLVTGHGKNQQKISDIERRTVLTMSYAVTGRLLLTESFRLFSDEVIHDLSRIFPFHATPLSARPLDAFVRSQPTVFDFPISTSWHQLVLYNDLEDEREFEVALAGDTAFGAMGLEPGRAYYVYDFWNDRYAGRVSGDAAIQQTVATGETRVLSVHAVENHPQWISTDRHVMQGYVDLVKKPQWTAATSSLSGTSSLIAGEPYRVTLALNGYKPDQVSAGSNASADITVRPDHPELADLVLGVKESRNIEWKVSFKK